ncbi:PREDICTED: beta-1,4 N-acetylgalactosaminyltransferase 1-like [Branchiostoma belcheri]|uniref:Beta-1,4 N-acetylgalactosaminyltransferase 1-like n=1 Tax=Branchiostoma belcheri TaxID=7741 RepID=A0A6P5AB05_BRABE|nr:PREDICTED: beta-1,4 N-acetylgalactosaminyltransferase 1-like [Branchiostoma belcheri]
MVILLMLALGATILENNQLKQVIRDSGPQATFVRTTGLKRDIKFPWKGDDLWNIPYVWKEHVARVPPPTPVLFTDGRSPLSYPTQGLRVQPMKTLVIPGVKLEESGNDKNKFVIQLNAGLGVLTTLADVPGVAAEGVGSKHLTISSASLEHLNRQLQFLVYNNTHFDPDTVDYVAIQYLHYSGSIPIRIRHKTLPQMFPIVPDDITTKVTIVTKTFLRYDRLRQLIDSVRRFYPNITIIIADDSEHPEKVEGHNIEQYIMPYGKGWFAGRNLGVSQVTTPYFLWVDDDFVFTSRTKIELLLQVIETTNLDVVGGVVGKGRSRFRHKIRIDDGDELGDCLYRIRGSYHAVEGFPDCEVADMVTNFFLADTIKARRAGFDPRFTRIAHSEFFQDGLGELRVASCSHVRIDHDHGGRQQKYDKYRYMTRTSLIELYMSLLYKYNLKCLSY